MRSTMQDFPLTIQAILRHGAEVNGDGQVITATADGSRSQSYADLGRRAARLANALRGLGVTGDDRVGTFQWNNGEHLEAYLAIPSMGAVLHTLNIRLFPEQLTYIANHAEDKVVIVDDSLVDLLAKQLPSFETVEHVVVAGPGREGRQPRRPAGHRQAGAPVRRAARRRGRQLRLAHDRRARRRGDVLHLRHDRPPEGRGLQPPVVVPPLDGRRHGHHRRPHLVRPGAADRADVPRELLGPGLRSRHDRCLPDHAGPVASGGPALPVHAGGASDHLRCGADGLERRARLPRPARGHQALRPPAAGAVRRLRRARWRCRRRSASGTASTWCRPGG